jgi:hypothetical protein
VPHSLTRSTPTPPSPHPSPPRSAAFRALLAAGDRGAVHPLLRWLLAQGPLLTRRAFVGHHLTLPEASGTGPPGCGAGYVLAAAAVGVRWRNLPLFDPAGPSDFSKPHTHDQSIANTHTHKHKHIQTHEHIHTHTRTPLTPPARQLPEDLAYDPAAADLKAAIRALHPAFVEAHRAAEAARADAE